MSEPRILDANQKFRVAPKLSPPAGGPLASKGQLASLAPQYALWACAAVSSGVLSELFFPSGGPTEFVLPALLAALFGLGIWLADINHRNGLGRGWIPDSLFGVFLSAVIFEWSYVLTILVSGDLEQFKAALLVMSP